MSSDTRDNRIDANNLGGSGLETSELIKRVSGDSGTKLRVAQRDRNFRCRANLEV